MPTSFNARMELTTEPNPDNYSYSVAENVEGSGSIVRTVVVNVANINAALNGVRDFIGTKIPGGEVVLHATLNVQTGPPPS